MREDRDRVLDWRVDWDRGLDHGGWAGTEAWTAEGGLGPRSGLLMFWMGPRVDWGLGSCWDGLRPGVVLGWTEA